MLALAMAPHVEGTARPPPVRIPKLKYRNHLPSEQALIPSQHPPTVSEPQAASVTSPSSRGTTNLASPTLASTTSSPPSNEAGPLSKKKRATSSVLSFLSLKEPTQSALDQLAKQQRMQPTGTSVAPSRWEFSSKYTNQKPPKTLSTANSKWDGAPGVKNNRHSTSSASSKSSRCRRVSRNSWSLPIKGLVPNDARRKDTSESRSNLSKSFASPPPSESSQLSKSVTSIDYVSPVARMPELSYYFPDAPTKALGILPSIRLEEQQSPRELPSRLADPITGIRSSTEGFVDARTPSSASAFSSPSPCSKSVNTMVSDTAQTILRKLNDPPHQDFYGDDAYVVQPSSTAHVPESNNFLLDLHVIVERRQDHTPKSSSYTLSSTTPHYAPDQSVHNSTRPMSSNGSKSQKARLLPKSSCRRTPSASTLPTVYEVSLASSTESLGTIREGGHVHVDEDVHSIVPSTPPSSERSIHSHKSPRERLGLGGRLKMNDLSPWDGPGEPRGKPKRSRFSIFLSTRN